MCSEFRLPTIGAEVARRFQADKQGTALKALLVVFELEAGDRRPRRVDRLHRAAKLSAAKAWESLDPDRLPAKRDLDLPHALRKLDSVDVLILDDRGYLRQRANGSEALFTLIAERQERRSIIVTSNMVFSPWEEIFQSPRATD